jgi:hypothetical protein
MKADHHMFPDLTQMRKWAKKALPPDCVEGAVKEWAEYMQIQKAFYKKHGLDVAKPEPVIDSPTKLKRKCRKWQEMWGRLNERNDYAPVETVHRLWGIMRDLAWGLDVACPPEPAPPTNLHEGIRFLDEVLSWCVQQEAGGEWLKVKEAAQVLNKSPSQVSRDAKSGKLKFKDHGKNRRICPLSLISYLKSRPAKYSKRETDAEVRARLDRATRRSN